MDCYLIKLFLLMCVFSGSQSFVAPKFDMPEVNVTVTVNHTAMLPCSVKFLGDHQVVWVDQFAKVLAFNERVIINDPRLSIERPFTKDWNLHIRDVKFSDQGTYTCQINTVEVMIKTIHLMVQVPARIINHLSTQDVTVQENDHVTLVCNVTGVPPAEVTWYRHVEGPRGVDKQSEFCPGTNVNHQVGVNGEVLVIHNVTRYCADVYECVAFNGVPPAVNHLIKVAVEFPPEIHLLNKRIGQVLGKETILECTITSFPIGTARWTRNGRELHNSAKYRQELYDEGDNSVTLSLHIRSIERHDFGSYTCHAVNMLGSDSESMILYEYSRYLVVTTTTTTPVTTTKKRRDHVRSTEARGIVRPSFVTPNSVFPRVEGRGHHSNSNPVNTVRSTTYPDSRILQHFGEGSKQRELESRAGVNEKSSAVGQHLSSMSASIVVFTIWLLQVCLS